MEHLISVIMSTYNESVEELKKSINSVLNQTYRKIEFIIVIDNPDNYEILNYLNTLNDERIMIIKNKKNIGLVASLNKALSQTKGEFIARMDADDISYLNRLSIQLSHIKKNNLDLIGGNIEYIDENDNLITRQHFPLEHSKINYFLKWGNCVPHPTWLVKRNVFQVLEGYRDIPRCEDYDFINRAIYNGFRIGNVKEYVLKYRIRGNSISNSNKGEQYIVRNYISKNRNKYISEKEIDNYIKSDWFKKEVNLYKDFQEKKQKIKRTKDIYLLLSLVKNKYAYYLAIEKIGLKLRNIA